MNKKVEFKAGDTCVITDGGPYDGKEVVLLNFIGQSPFVPDEGDGWWVQTCGFTVACTFNEDATEFWFPERRMEVKQGALQ